MFEKLSKSLDEIVIVFRVTFVFPVLDQFQYLSLYQIEAQAWEYIGLENTREYFTICL